MWLNYELIDQRNHGLLPNRRKRFFLFYIMSRWSRNYPVSYSMGTRSKVAGVWTRAFMSICSQDYECIQLHCHHYPYIFVTACQWFYHWLTISPYSFLYGQVYFLLPNLLGQTQKNVDHPGIYTTLSGEVTNVLEECTACVFHSLAVQEVLTTRLSVWRQ